IESKTTPQATRKRCPACPWERRRRKQRKPPSNPPGWSEGKSTVYDIAQRPNRIVVINGEQETEFVSNMVRTAKYKYYDFLPKFLWEEFNPATKIANVYFLFIAALQVVPSITNTFGIPLMLLPLFFVVCVDAIFMIFEDVARHRADKHANSSLTRAWDRRSGDFKLIPWREIEVGDLIIINNREAIPCDVLIMGVDEPISRSPAGIAYVETKSLDGETNLKIRQVVKGVLGKLVIPEDCCLLAGRVVMEHPDKLINNFKGKLLLLQDHHGRSSISSAANAGRRRKSLRRGSHAKNQEGNLGCGGDGRDTELLNGVGEAGAAEPSGAIETGGGEGTASEPISADMLLLRGCVLRNTRWVVGLALNTGPDTKIMMSMSKAPWKASHLSCRINEEIKRVAVVMGSACLIGAVLTTISNAQYQDTKIYLGFESSTDNLAGMFFTQFLYNALLLNSFIPISLYVSMNFVRFIQGWFMNQDLEMYHDESDTPARVRTMNLNEDLGQVSHIFSDKTGTLTCNIMDFRKFSVGGISYGLGITEIGRAAMVVEGQEVPEDVLDAEEKAKDYAAPHVNFYDPSVYRDLRGEGPGGQQQARKVRDFFTALALCHTVIPERFEDTDEVILSASSPDDEALVLGAKYFGFEFVKRIDCSAILHTWDVTAPPPPSPERSVAGGAGSLSSSAVGGGGCGGGGACTSAGTSAGSAGVAGAGAGAGGIAVRAVALAMPAHHSKATFLNTIRDPEDDGAEGCDDLKAATARGSGGREREEGVGESKEAGGGKPGFTREPYQVLHVLGFTSDRKRMSVIVRETDGTIKIICKGADTTMLPRLRTDYPGAEKAIEETVKHMDVFAREGLRTLVVAQAELDPEAFHEWEKSFDEKASNDLAEIDKRNMGEPNRIEESMELVETNLEIIGSSAIEDKLQAGVAGAVSDLMAAGIKVWVLTGDKEETAINIAVACQLLWTEAKMHRTVINLKGTGESETEDITRILEEFLTKRIEERDRFEEDETGKVEPPLPRGLVIDGPALLEAMKTSESQCALLRAAQTCHSVVGCRLSPDQKRALVALVRENVPGARTLSIGDGANDVPMIQRAHIGVGISGQEGMQAVNASDYAIAQFAYLRKLLLVHGRWNYRRSSRVVCYLFYKSVMFACPLIFYAYTNGFSGTLFYDYVTCNMYAIVYTALPILLYGTYDRDISAETCLRYPQLYAYGIEDRCMRPTIFWSWVLQARNSDAVVESAFLTLTPILLLSGDATGRGVVTSTYEYGTMTYALVVVQVTFKMFWVQYRWTRIHALVLMFSIYAFFISAFLVNAWVAISWDYHGVVDALLQSRPFWATMIWCLVVVVGRDWAWKFHHRWWSPELHHLMLESDKLALNEKAAAARRISADGGHADIGAKSDTKAPDTSPPSTQPPQQKAGSSDDIENGAHVVGRSRSSSSSDRGSKGPVETSKTMSRSLSAAYVGAGLFHRHKHRRSKTASPLAPGTAGEAAAPATPLGGAPSGSQHYWKGRSGTQSFVDPVVDDSIGGLLESTFSPKAHGRSQAFMPLPMNALTETLRERRDNRKGGGGGGGKYNVTGRNPFSATMQSRFGGGGGRHARGVSASATERDRGGGGGGGGGRGRRASGGGEHAAAAAAGAAVVDNDSDEWDPFVSDSATATAAAASAESAAPTRRKSSSYDGDKNTAGHDGGGPRNGAALQRTKSRKLLQAGELSGRDPREAAKLMTERTPVFVEVDEEGAPAPRESKHHNAHTPRPRLHQLGRRQSDCDAIAVPTSPSPFAAFSPKTIFRRFSLAENSTDNADSGSASARGSLADALERRDNQRRRSSMSATTSGPDTVRVSSLSPNPTSAGGFAFSCDAQAQRAEIAMILGTRASPTPQTASFLAQRRSSAQARASAKALGGVSKDGGVVSDSDGDGDDGGNGGGDKGGRGKELPPLQRRSSGPTAAAAAAAATAPDLGPTRGYLSSRRVSDAPGGVAEEVEKGGGAEDEEVRRV
ncbi:unnamed protein product, partial [Pylaiella littoralis]